MAATWSRPRCWAVVAIAAAVFILHARSIDAVCDDAFISLRYARNLVDHGAPVYNLGERVEGYTSPLWMLLSAAPLALGIEGSKVLSLMGLFGGVALVAAVWRLWTVVAPARPVPGFVVLGLVVASTPLAAWSSSGLETTAFAAMIALSVAEAAAFVGQPTRARGYVAGGVIALTTLLRPEGALIGAVAFVCLALNRGTRLQLLPFLLAAAAPVSVFVLWRLWYYGELLPNTFFAKLSAAPWRRIQVGLRYSFFTVSELGFAFSTLLLLSAIVAPWKAPATRIIRPIIPVYIAYVLYVGGDFFDLFRFFVPILPLLLVSLVASALALESYLGMTTRAWMVLFGLAAPAYLASQNLAAEPRAPDRGAGASGGRDRAARVDEALRRHLGGHRPLSSRPRAGRRFHGRRRGRRGSLLLGASEPRLARLERRGGRPTWPSTRQQAGPSASGEARLRTVAAPDLSDAHRLHLALARQLGR